MSEESHVALYPGAPHYGDQSRGHFVPEGWEPADRGLCPCGEVVVWNPVTEYWEADRTMRVLVLTADEAASLKRSTSGLTYENVLIQLAVQDVAGQDWEVQS